MNEFSPYSFSYGEGYFDFSYLYDHFMFDVDYPSRAAYLAALFSEHGDKKIVSVLDLACGTGNLTFELWRLGYDLIGVDSSEDMLSVAQDKLSGLDLDRELPMFLKQDMRKLDLYGTVQAAVCVTDSINHLLTIEDVKQTFSRLKFFIEPGGLFIFDVNTIYKHENILGNNNFIYEKDNIFLSWVNEYESDTHIVNMYLDFFIEDENNGEIIYNRVSEKVAERAYYLKELELALDENEFDLAAVYDDLTFNSYRKNSEKLTIVARRKGDMNER